MQRRKFIKYTATSAGLASYFKLGQIPVFANSQNQFSALAEDDKIIVIIQLFGGNDGLNTIIPADDDRYYNKYRTSLNIPKNKALRLSNTSSYLNPALKSGLNEGFYGLYKDGKLGIIQGVGYPKPNLSHFRSADIWLSGIMPDNDSQRLETGWLGRYFEKTQTQTEPDFPISIDIGTSSSLLFQAKKQNMAISLDNPKDFYDSGKDILTGDTKLNDSTVFSSERDFLLNLSIQTNKYSAVVKSAFDSGKNVANYENEKLSDELKLVARLISGGMKTKVYKVSIDGFDTHANQGADSGKHASLLTSISKAVGAFMDDLKSQKLSEKVLGFTVSEFGRRPEQNASGGTDHGAASVMFAFGDAINGKVFGKNLSFDSLDSNKDFIYQYDYRQVYDEIMTKWFGSDATTTKEILAGRFKQIEDGLIFTGKALSVEESIQKNSNIFPNPTTDGLVTLNVFLEKPSTVAVSMTDVLGKQKDLMPKVFLPEGSHQIPLDLEITNNMCFLRVLLNGKVEVHKVIKV